MRAVKLTIGGIAILVAGVVCGVGLERSGRLGGAGSGGDQAGQPTTPSEAPKSLAVVTSSVRRGALTTPVEMLGAIASAPGASVSVSLAEEVVVSDILARPGVIVEKGTPVFRVEPSPAATSRLQAAKASVDSARALLSESKARIDARVGTRQELVQAEQSLASAEVQLKAIQDSLPPANGEILAPSTGVLTLGMSTSGSVVQPGTPLFTVADADQIAARFGVPIGVLDSIPGGTEVGIESLLSSSKPKRASVVKFVESEVDPLARSKPAWSDVIPASDWSRGEPVRVTAQAQSPEGMLMPRAALALSDGNPIVFVVRDGVAHAMAVRVLAGNAQTVCVASEGLSETDHVITTGAHVIEDGAAVREEPRP